MQQAGFLTARRSRTKVALRILLGGLILSGPGCHQHYYYYGNTADGCPPISPATVVDGPVCDSSSPVIQGGTVVSSVSDAPTTRSKPRRSKVVVSEANSGGKSSWQAVGPESSVARTQVDGAIDDSILK